MTCRLDFVWVICLRFSLVLGAVGCVDAMCFFLYEHLDLALRCILWLFWRQEVKVSLLYFFRADYVPSITWIDPILLYVSLFFFGEKITIREEKLWKPSDACHVHREHRWEQAVGAGKPRPCSCPPLPPLAAASPCTPPLRLSALSVRCRAVAGRPPYIFPIPNPYSGHSYMLW